MTTKGGGWELDHELSRRIHGTAGGSARRTHELRSQRDRDRRPERLLRAAPVAGVLAIFTHAIISPLGDGLALAASLVVAGSIVVRVLEPRRQTSAWATGASGEEITAAELDPLVVDGYHVFHDLRIPGSRANIDHVVVGPAGCFVVETKRYSGQLTLSGGEFRVNGRRIDVADQVERGIEEVARVVWPLGVRVFGVICLQKANLPIFRRSIDGIPILRPSQLARRLRSGDPALSRAEIERAAAAIEAAFDFA